MFILWFKCTRLLFVKLLIMVSCIQSGLYGLTLSPTDREGFRNVFFHALASTMEFAVNSRYLQNTSLASEQMRAFKVVGDRGTGGQSFSSFLDEETGVLFYTLYNTHAVGCWNSFKLVVQLTIYYLIFCPCGEIKRPKYLSTMYVIDWETILIL